MKQSHYNFERCKLCGQTVAVATYPLSKSGCIYACSNCDFHYLDVLDDETQAASDLHLDEASRRYIEARLAESRYLHPERLKLIEKHLPLPSITALDVGAGLGQFQLLINKAGGISLGIEPSRVRREYATEKFGIELTETLIDQPFWQEKFANHFNLITLWDVIEHVNFPRETLFAATKLLKSGGIIGIETPSRDVAAYQLSLTAHRLSKGKFSLFLPNFYSTARYGHKQIFTRQQLRDLLERAGFEIIELRHSYTTKLFPGNKIIIVAKKR